MNITAAQAAEANILGIKINFSSTIILTQNQDQADICFPDVAAIRSHPSQCPLPAQFVSFSNSNANFYSRAIADVSNMKASLSTREIEYLI
ncbi:hypothetical protein LPB140_03230 [Sphingorhabdus lutea]|uniref:Uncharacterized protein n=1 Tax=Sphingorhabdus lutea TaxID=1913578 RepID=A0A1L3JA36_9SPHN|nr:hypothetical protein LPB140_03230 [Sphingorhabdus lutea]